MFNDSSPGLVVMVEKRVLRWGLYCKRLVTKLSVSVVAYRPLIGYTNDAVLYIPTDSDLERDLVRSLLPMTFPNEEDILHTPTDL